MREFILSIDEYWRCGIFMCAGAILSLVMFFCLQFIEHLYKKIQIRILTKKLDKKMRTQRIEQRQINKRKMVVEQARFEELAERNKK